MNAYRLTNRVLTELISNLNFGTDCDTGSTVLDMPPTGQFAHHTLYSKSFGCTWHTPLSPTNRHRQPYRKKIAHVPPTQLRNGGVCLHWPQCGQTRCPVSTPPQALSDSTKPSDLWFFFFFLTPPVQPKNTPTSTRRSSRLLIQLTRSQHVATLCDTKMTQPSQGTPAPYHFPFLQ